MTTERSLYDTLRQTNDRLAYIRKQADAAAEMENKGDKFHGSALILRIATIAAAIRTNCFQAEDVTFTVNHAVAASKIMFDRVNFEDVDGDQGISNSKAVAAWRTHITRVLHPYIINKTEYPVQTTAATVRREFSDGGKKSVPDNILKMIAVTELQRKRAAFAFDVACLYVSLDGSGTLLEQFSPENGLAIMCSHVLPIERTKEGVMLTYRPLGEDKVVRIKPTVGTRVYVTGFADRGEDGDNTKRFAVSVDALLTAWKLPKTVDRGDNLSSAFKLVANTLKVDTKLTAEQFALLKAANNAIQQFMQAREKAIELAKVATDKARKAS